MANIGWLMAQALTEDAARSGRLPHTDACDMLFAEFQGYSQERTGQHHAWTDLRDCGCERAFRRAIASDCPTESQDRPPKASP